LESCRKSQSFSDEVVAVMSN